MKPLKRVETIVPRRAAGYGAKARNLAALARAGFAVPPAYAMPGQTCSAFLREVLGEDETLEALTRRGGEALTDKRLKGIADRIRKAPLSRSLRGALRDCLGALRRGGAESVAVRSSSTREDLEAASAAGLHKTTLHIVDEESLYAAVKDTWASLYSRSVIEYLEQVGGALDAQVGVLIQAMVNPDVSGVVFTVNPLTGDPNEIVVDASYGLGPLVVDGRVSVDTWRMSKGTSALRDHILGRKERRLVAEGDKLVERENSESDRARPCLDDATLAELLRVASRVEEHFQGPQDIEWAVADGQLYLLQARPVTTTRRNSKPAFEEERLPRAEIVWSNANVGEALPGVPTPLTWSVLANFSELGFRRAFGSLGCSVPKGAELFGSFRGRIYLNLSEVMNIASQVPGVKPSTLLALGGGGGADILDENHKRRPSAGFVMRLPLTAARYGKENWKLAEKVKTFEARFESERRRIEQIDLAMLSSTKVSRVLSDIERLLDDAGGVMLNCYGNLLACVLALRTILRFLVGPEAESYERRLFSGLADVESAAPALALWHIAEMARAEPMIKTAILNREASLVDELNEGPAKRALIRFLDAHGHRGAREAELCEPRWREDPSLIFAALRVHLGETSGERPVDIERRQSEVRAAAQEQLELRLPFALTPPFRHLISIVQRFVRVRERLRGIVTRILGMFRVVALDASRRMDERESLGADGAFYLSMEELHQYLRGELSVVGSTIAKRRRQYDRDRSLPDPPDTFVGFPPGPETPPDSEELEGLAASPGIVRGSARVVREHNEVLELQRGEILVVSSADVGLSPLLLIAGGVVTDLGGPLSHAAVVLREFGVPAVFNVRYGTQTIETGDLIEVDGERGIVTRLERAGQSSTESVRPDANA